VVEGDHRLDAARVAAVDHRLVVIEHGDGKCAWLRLDPGPFQGKPIRVEMQGFDDIEIERPAVKTVAGIARRFGKRGRIKMLGRPAVAVGVVAFHLVSRRRRAPQEAFPGT
jgi:hypothetical protein